MPTDLPPDYKPEPVQPGDGKVPEAVPSPGGTDSKQPGGPKPGAAPKGADVVDPPGWKQPPSSPDGDPLGVPTPAGTPVF